MLTDDKGIPFSVAVDGANRHDKMLVKGLMMPQLFKDLHIK